MASKRDYYEVLGANKNMSKEEISKLYKKAAMKYHPDRQHGKSDSEKKEAEEKFKECAEAAEVLLDDDKRKNYDRFGFNGSGGFGGQNIDPREFFRHHASMFGDFFGAGFGSDFGFDPFGGMRGGMGDKNDPNAPRDGQDVRVGISVEFEDAIYGMHKEFDIKLDDPCDHCHGTKSEDGKTKTCPSCNGTGMMTQVRGPMIMNSTCSTCHGEGVVVEHPCTHCNGTGFEKKTHHVNINIPMGINTGSTLRVSGSGQGGINGGAAGDLYINVSVQDNDLFQRDNLDLYSEATISPIVAAIGGTADVLTPWGKASIKINPGTISGKQLRLNEKGIHLPNGQKGNLYVVIRVDTFSNLTDTQKKELEEFGKSLSKNNFKNLDVYNVNTDMYLKKNKDRMKK